MLLLIMIRVQYFANFAGDVAVTVRYFANLHVTPQLSLALLAFGV